MPETLDIKVYGEPGDPWTFDSGSSCGCAVEGVSIDRDYRRRDGQIVRCGGVMTRDDAMRLRNWLSDRIKAVPDAVRPPETPPQTRVRSQPVPEQPQPIRDEPVLPRPSEKGSDVAEGVLLLSLYWERYGVRRWRLVRGLPPDDQYVIYVDGDAGVMEANIARRVRVTGKKEWLGDHKTHVLQAERVEVVE